MFEVNYSYFIESSCFDNFTISYMPGLKVSDVYNAKCVVNIDSKTVYIYC